MRFSKYQIMLWVAIVIFITMNPMTVEIFIDWYKWIFTGLSVLAVVYIVVFTLYYAFKPTEVKIPNKTKKSKVKSDEYLEI